MTTLRYGLACLAVLMAGVLGAAVLLDHRGLVGVMAAGAVALPIQVTAFALLARTRQARHAFLAVWAGGILVRMAAIGLAGWALAVLPGLPAAPTLIGLAAFFSATTLLEPRYLGQRRK